MSFYYMLGQGNAITDLYETISSINNQRLFLVTTAVVLIFLAGVFGFKGENFQDQDETKVALIVFDGGEWKIVNRLENQGRLPAISKAMEDGIHGNLSTPRSFSPVTWTKIATGQSTEDVKVSGWNSETEEGSQRVVSSKDVKNYRIWNYLNRAGISTGVVNYLLTWPLEKVKGYMVADTLARGPERLYPKDKFNNESLMKHGSEWEKANKALDDHTNIDFLTLGFKRIDGIQHHLWKFVEPEPFGLQRQEKNDKYRELVYSEYESLDQIVSRLGEDWNIIIVSDSGFQPEGMNEPGDIMPTQAVNLRPLLQELDYAKYNVRQDYGQVIMRVQKEESQLQNYYFEYPLKPTINATHYRFKFKVIDPSLDVEKTIDRLKNVDYRNSSDFFYDIEKIEEGDNTFIKGRYKVKKEDIVDKKVVESYVNHPTVPKPLTHVESALGLELPDGTEYNLWTDAEQSGDHPPGTDGMIIASGPDIANKGYIGETVRASDIAPTILYMYGVPVPKGMDGEVKTHLFTEEFNEKRDIDYSEISTLDSGNISDLENKSIREQALKKKLRNLGYAVK